MRISISLNTNFEQWFRGSKVVDKNGKPLVVYHGTGVNYDNRGNKVGGAFDVFDGTLSGKSSKTGAPENTFFFTDNPHVASSYTVKYKGDFITKYKDEAHVLPVYLNIKKPLKLSAKGSNWREILYKDEYYDINAIASCAKLSGRYDGVIITRVVDSGIGSGLNKPATTYIAFYPNQIKSAIGNSGNFSPTNNSITAGSIGVLSDVMKQWKSAGIDSWIYEYESHISLSKILVPKDKRKQGLGTWAMNILCDYADAHQKFVTLSPSTDFGATSKERLIKFYKQFGFVPNKGKFKQYKFSETMYRKPQ